MLHFSRSVARKSSAIVRFIAVREGNLVQLAKRPSDDRRTRLISLSQSAAGLIHRRISRSTCRDNINPLRDDRLTYYEVEQILLKEMFLSIKSFLKKEQLKWIFILRQIVFPNLQDEIK